jgi:hypothetical protein
MCCPLLFLWCHRLLGHLGSQRFPLGIPPLDRLLLLGFHLGLCLILIPFGARLLLGLFLELSPFLCREAPPISLRLLPLVPSELDRLWFDGGCGGRYLCLEFRGFFTGRLDRNLSGRRFGLGNGTVTLLYWAFYNRVE